MVLCKIDLARTLTCSALSVNLGVYQITNNPNAYHGRDGTDHRPTSPALINHRIDQEDGRSPLLAKSVISASLQPATRRSDLFPGRLLLVHCPHSAQYRSPIARDALHTDIRLGTPANQRTYIGLWSTMPYSMETSSTRQECVKPFFPCSYREQSGIQTLQTLFPIRTSLVRNMVPRAMEEISGRA